RAGRGAGFKRSREPNDRACLAGATRQGGDRSLNHGNSSLPWCRSSGNPYRLAPDVMKLNDPEAIDRILLECRIIAVVGLSSRPWRPSHDVAAYMQRAGYRVIPVNPHETEVLGERSYDLLADVPDKIDLVNIFRRPEEAGMAVDQ